MRVQKLKNVERSEICRGDESAYFELVAKRSSLADKEKKMVYSGGGRGSGVPGSGVRRSLPMRSLLGFAVVSGAGYFIKTMKYDENKGQGESVPSFKELEKKNQFVQLRLSGLFRVEDSNLRRAKGKVPDDVDKIEMPAEHGMCRKGYVMPYKLEGNWESARNDSIL